MAKPPPLPLFCTFGPASSSRWAAPMARCEHAVRSVTAAAEEGSGVVSYDGGGGGIIGRGGGLAMGRAATAIHNIKAARRGLRRMAAVTEGARLVAGD